VLPPRYGPMGGMSHGEAARPVSEPNIFISYRRKDSAPYARGIFDRLAERFGADRVFMDLSIPPGMDFVQVIEGSVRSASAVIVIIGPAWVLNADGKHRLEDPGDFVALEVAAALADNDLVIPVLVGGAIMPKPEDLPERIRPLSRREALELSDQRWDYDVGRLADRLQEIVPAMAAARVAGDVTDAAPQAHAHPSAVRDALKRGPVRMGLAAAAVALVLLGAWAIFLGGGPKLGDRVLVRGDTGADVRQLQVALSRLGFNSGLADGNFNVQTSSAVISFQTCWGEGLVPDGRVTKQMADALQDPRIHTGTDGADVLTGTLGNDLLFSMGGQDRIDGLGGDDKICAGEGNDIVVGGPGNDRLFGGAANDILQGDAGDDTLLGFKNNDALDGGTGADTMDGGAGTDTCLSGPGENDVLTSCEA
jgi:TIR domain-containing protein/putative peptidoglycan binding protein/hemolysin type calcium-binding protein